MIVYHLHRRCQRRHHHQLWRKYRLRHCCRRSRCRRDRISRQLLLTRRRPVFHKDATILS